MGLFSYFLKKRFMFETSESESSENESSENESCGVESLLPMPLSISYTKSLT